jgi:imidazole glycerol-phosphate synthase subunit HisF
MRTHRIIPRLDIKGPNLVKGIHFEGLRVLGKPEAFARHYYLNGADELIYMDVVASLYGRNSLLDIIARTSREIFIPLTVGGGIKSVDEVREVLRAGADKVAINTAALKSPQLIADAASAFGASTIQVSIEAIRRPDGSYEAYADYGRESTGMDAVAWAAQAAQLGAGELMVTSIDREGTGKGFDIELVRQISAQVDIPVIAGGGAGAPEHVASVLTAGRADAVALASLLHYSLIRDQTFNRDEFQEEGNTEFLSGRQSSTSMSRIASTDLDQLKIHLRSAGLGMRIEQAG